MDEAFDLANYLPMSFKATNEQDYISFLWGVFEENYNRDKYHFAFIAYHMLMMSFVYYTIWKVRKTRPNNFEISLIGFSKDDQATLLSGTSPFIFSKIHERSIFNLLKLIECNDSNIGSYRKLVDDRNYAAHANGNIYFQTQHEMDTKINTVLKAVKEIQIHSKSTIISCYENFLRANDDQRKWEYMLVDDQIHEVLIRSNYISKKDIEICTNADISHLQYNKTVRTLHEALRTVSNEVV